MRNTIYSLTFIVIVGLLGCGEKAQTTTEPKTNIADSVSPKTVEAVKKEVVQAALPKADKSTPLENFVEYDSGNQLMFSFLALADMPIDYKEISAVYSQDYASASDEFKKNDLLTALKPRIDAEISKAKSQRYIKITIDSPIEKYDFEKKGFPLSTSIWESGSYRYFNDNNAYKLGFTNGEMFRYLTIAEETTARNIEALRSKYEPLNLIIYAYIQYSDLTNKTIKSEIVKVILKDKKGTNLANQ